MVQGKNAEAESLYERAAEIWETAFGPDDPTVATALNNRAGLLVEQVRAARDLWKHSCEQGERKGV